MKNRRHAKTKLAQIKIETYALYLAARDPRTPWYVKYIVAGIVAYAISPIDLIPDFIPVLGLLDDMILIPLGISLAIKLTPPNVLSECRVISEQMFKQSAPVSRIAGGIVLIIWLIFILLCINWIFTNMTI